MMQYRLAMDDVNLLVGERQLLASAHKSVHPVGDTGRLGHFLHVGDRYWGHIASVHLPGTR